MANTPSDITCIEYRAPLYAKQDEYIDFTHIHITPCSWIDGHVSLHDVMKSLPSLSVNTTQFTMPTRAGKQTCIRKSHPGAQTSLGVCLYTFLTPLYMHAYVTI